MALKINLKDSESVYFGTTKVTAVHDGGYTILLVDGSSLPVMKESETIALDDADTPVKRIYYHLQQHYLSGDRDHMGIAASIATALAVDDYQEFKKALDDIRQGNQFRGLRRARRLAGL